MKSTALAAIFFLLAFCSVLNGQTEEQYRKKIQHYKAERTAGMVMMITAAPLGMLGTHWIIQGNKYLNSEEEPWGGYWAGSIELLAGCVCVGVATGLLAGGTVMNVIGNKKAHKYEEKLTGLKVGLFCTPKQAGLTLTYQF